MNKSPTSRAHFSLHTVAIALCIAMLSFPPSLDAQQTNPTSSKAGPVPSAIAQARADSARYPYTSADIAFMTGMIGHHAQAIVMAKMAPSHGANAEVTTLAARIINAQQDEISIMARWLRDRLQPVPDTTGGMMMMDGHMMNMSGGMSASMPGMLSALQLDSLDTARGASFDHLFLTYMIQHHTGATAMVQKLFATDGAAQDETVFKFASDVNVDQSTEIARMQRMLIMLKLQGKIP